MIRKHNPDAAPPCPSTSPSADVSVRFGPADVEALEAMGRIAARAVIARRRHGKSTADWYKPRVWGAKT